MSNDKSNPKSKFQIEIKSLSALNDAAKLFLNKFKEKRVFAFYGDMGIGKTTFIKAVCKQLSVVGVVNSPSFAIVHQYQTKKKQVIYHLDFYRIKKIDEVFALGYEDYFYSNNYCFIEWPEIIKSLLPEDHVAVYMSGDFEGSRYLKIK